MLNDFEAPSKSMSFLAYLGGVVSAIALIAGLQLVENQVSQTPITAQPSKCNYQK